MLRSDFIIDCTSSKRWLREFATHEAGIVSSPPINCALSVCTVSVPIDAIGSIGIILKRLAVEAATGGHRRQPHQRDCTCVETIVSAIDTGGVAHRPLLVTATYRGLLTIRQDHWKAIFGTKWSGGHSTSEPE